MTVRVLAPLLGRAAAETTRTVVIAMWPFMRILMLIVLASTLAAFACYYFEYRQTVSVEDGDSANGKIAMKTYRDANGAVILRKKATVDDDIRRRLLDAGHTEIVVHDDMYSSPVDALWWGFVTMTTVGYGDKYPRSFGGRAVAVLLMFSGIVLVSSFTATISSVFVARRLQEAQRSRDIEWIDHVVFCGWNDMAPRVLQALNRTTTDTRQVVLVNGRTDEAMELQLRSYPRLEMRFVRGNFNREDDLRRANIRAAAVAIIVPDASDGQQATDSKTYEATTLIKDIAADVKVFAHILNEENVANLRRAQVDDIVVTDEFTTELLAGHIATPGMPQAIRSFLAPDGEVELAVEEIAELFHEEPVAVLWDHLRHERGKILIGLVMEEEGMGLEAAMGGGDAYITEFIKEQIELAGITTQTQGSRTRVTLHPPNDYIVHATDRALVIRNRATQATQPATPAT